MRKHTRRIHHHQHVSLLRRLKKKLFPFYLIISSVVICALLVFVGQRIFFPQADIFVGEPVTSIRVSGTSYGVADLALGLTVPPVLSDADSQRLLTIFPGHNVYLKINNPSPASLNSTFRQLNGLGFRWYFSFPQDGSASTFLSSFAAQFPGKQAVVEIRTGTPDASFLTNLKQSFPFILLHIQTDGANWNDGKIRTAFHVPGVSPPLLDAASYGNAKTSDWADGVFNSVRSRFDMMFDGSVDLNGTIDYPAGARLSLSNMRITSSGARENMSFWAGVIAGAITNNVQMKGKTPLKYLLYGDMNLPDEGKHIIRYAADFISQSPEIIWPMAIPQNGNPWDNAFLSQSNSLPFVGIIGKTSAGYFFLMTNTLNEGAIASFPGGINLTSYQFYSNQRGSGNFAVSANQLAFQPFEVIIGTVGLPTAPVLPPSPTPIPGSAPPDDPFIPPVNYISPTPTPFFSPHFRVMGKIYTGTLDSAGKMWQSGDFCGPYYDTYRSLRVSGAEVGKFDGFSLCNPDPFYLYTAYAPAKSEATGPVTITLQNLPPGYSCTGWVWISGDEIETRTGTGCSMTADFRDILPFSETGNHHISFFIHNPNPPTPTPLPATPTRGPRPRPSRTPTPLVSLVPISIPAMAVQLGAPPERPGLIQSFFFWIGGFIKVFVQPPAPPPVEIAHVSPTLSPYPSSLPPAPPTIVFGPPTTSGGQDTPGPGPGTSPVPIPPSKTPTPFTPPSPTPTIVMIACPPPSGSFDTLSEHLPSYPSGDPPANAHPDLNLAIRGFQSTNGQLGLISYTGTTAPGKPPQLSTLFGGNRPANFFRLYKVHDWNWATNSKGGLATNFPVTLAGLVATPGEKLYPPYSTYDVGEDKPVATDPYQVLVVYAETHRITLKYDRNDHAAKGFTLHLENICVNPNLIARYNQSNAGGRRSLPSLRTRDSFGVARANEVIVAIRTDGSFMDPRSRKDWWQ